MLRAGHRGRAGKPLGVAAPPRRRSVQPSAAHASPSPPRSRWASPLHRIERRRRERERGGGGRALLHEPDLRRFCSVCASPAPPRPGTRPTAPSPAARQAGPRPVSPSATAAALAAGYAQAFGFASGNGPCWLATPVCVCPCRRGRAPRARAVKSPQRPSSVAASRSARTPALVSHGRAGFRHRQTPSPTACQHRTRARPDQAVESSRSTHMQWPREGGVMALREASHSLVPARPAEWAEQTLAARVGEIKQPCHLPQAQDDVVYIEFVEAATAGNAGLNGRQA